MAAVKWRSSSRTRGIYLHVAHNTGTPTQSALLHSRSTCIISHGASVTRCFSTFASISSVLKVHLMDICNICTSGGNEFARVPFAQFVAPKLAKAQACLMRDPRSPLWPPSLPPPFSGWVDQIPLYCFSRAASNEVPLECLPYEI